MKSKSTIVRAKLISATPDTTEYQKYRPVLEFADTFVDIPIPSEHAQVEGNKIILSLAGMTALLTAPAYELHSAYLRSIRKLTQ